MTTLNGSKLLKVLAFVLFVIAAVLCFGVAFDWVTSAKAVTVAFALAFSGLASWVLSNLSP